MGVGKTLTGIAVAARMRQDGRARRILCVLPNTIMLKWEKEIRRALPDYRVVLIGVEKYVGRSGVLRSRTDTSEERALKYRQFQAGEYDIALVTYSMFGRTGLRTETLRRFVAASPPVQRELGLRVKNTLVDFELQEEKQDHTAEKKGRPKRKKASLAAVRRVLGVEAVEAASPFELEQLRAEVAAGLEKESAAQHDELKELLDRQTDISERNRAVLALEVDRWVAEMLESQDQDPGIYWEDLKVDLVILDEAQNFKNLWAVAEREGGLPKYLGAISEGSQRAWNFALRAFEVRERNGGSGVVLLSATPAKNSPLEYFSLLGYVDTEAWTRLGILNPEVFIDRYLRLERRWLIEPDLTKKERSVVAGFKHLNELRDIIFRYGEFRTAEEVGLKLPESQVETRAVPMSPVQKASYSLLVLDYTNALRRAAEDPQARLKALGTLQRMALVSIHPELDTPPKEEVRAGVSLKDLPPDESDEPINSEGSGEATKRESEKRTSSERRGHWTWRNAKLASNPRSPKIEEAARIGVAAKNCAVIYFCENVAVHFWLKQELIRVGVPAERIAVLNADTAPTAQHRQTVAEKFNGIPPVLDAAGRVEQEGVTPEFDHVIANAVAYEGIDLQVRTCQIIHLDLPWEPATLQQRNGRAVRQGNLQSVIRILYILSAGSVDVIRLQMITGKLGWMRDILQGADRETNNPAAQSELSVEEMLLYLAGGDAEQAIAELRRQQEEDRRKNVLKNAWTTLSALISRVASLARLTDVEEQATVHAAIEEAKRRLLQMPSEIWPWAFVIAIAERGTPMLIVELQKGELAPLWEGARLFVVGAGGMEVGRVDGDAFGARWFREHAFHPFDSQSPDFRRKLQDAGSLLQRPNSKAYQGAWPEPEDRAGLEPGLRKALEGVALGEFEGVGLRWAHDTHRLWFWKTWGLQYVTSLSEAPASESFVVPVLERAEFKLVPAGPLIKRFASPTAVISVLEPTAAGWKDYLKLAAVTQGLKWADLNICADIWWGRTFPRGILPKAREPDEQEHWVDVKTKEGSERILAAWKTRYFAIHRPLGEGETAKEYSVTHLPSGLRATRVPTVEHGRAVIRYLEAQPIQWEAREPQYSSDLGQKLGADLKSLAESERPEAVLSRLLAQK